MIILVFLTISLGSCLLLGIYARGFSREGSALDYFLASKQIGTLTSGLSIAATCSSGFTFTGLVGLYISLGFSAIWFSLGICIGSTAAFLCFAHQLRASSAISLEKHLAGGSQKLGMLFSFISVPVMTLYAAAQIKAADQAFQIIDFGPRHTGGFLATALVFLYCWSGGIRASIFTDVFQVFVMLGSLAILAFVLHAQLGGISGIYTELGSIDIRDTSLTNTPSAVLLFTAGWIFAGFTFASWPHAMSRFMALENNRAVYRTVFTFTSFFIVSHLLIGFVAISAKVFLVNYSYSKEIALFLVAQDIFSEHGIGGYLGQAMYEVFLAGFFASAVSTSDSLILACSSSIYDIRGAINKSSSSLTKPKILTSLFCLLAFLVALFDNQSIFDSVMLCASAMGGAFIPTLVIRSLQKNPNSTALGGIALLGVAISISWRLLDYHKLVSEALPATLIPLAIWWIGHQIKSKLTKPT